MPARRDGFTLIELVIAMTIIVVIVGVAIPAMQGVSDERNARKPIDALADMVQEVRSKAMIEQEAYQIVFDAEGFYALRYFNSYRNRDDFKQLLIEMQKPQDAEGVATDTVERSGATTGDGQVVEAAPNLLTEINEGRPEAKVAMRRDTWLKSFKKPVDIDLTLLFWGDPKWNKVENDYFRRWVFQPTGMCNPLQVRSEIGDGFFEIQFDPLTGEVLREKFYVPPEEKDK
ncbi:MAG: prepilin-type N-terminal cleavage/methylation domain-containing protein [Verrucomicrobiales bacterium]|nr:prepilin-type N-terminal cleavage/methylation domain-containing protein [Verrucomicrobiae bacterium]